MKPILLLVHGLALGDDLFHGEDAIQLLAEGTEALVDKSHHGTIIGGRNVIVSCVGRHLYPSTSFCCSFS